MAGISGEVAHAVEHLRKASESVDRLWRATGEDRADEAVIGLGEASLAIHQALVALAEWDSSSGADPGCASGGAPIGHPTLRPSLG